MIYHIISNELWSSVKKGTEFRPASLEDEGFIHCSDIEKVATVANSIYSGQSNMVLLELDENRVQAEIVWEDLYNLNHKYPHIYGPLNLDAVIGVHDLQIDSQGSFQLPDTLK